MPEPMSTQNGASTLSASESSVIQPTIVEKQQRLRPLVISMGGERQARMTEMFASMSTHFEPPTFSTGVQQRNLRSRIGFISAAYAAGLIPEQEWEAFHKSHCEIPTSRYYDNNTDTSSSDNNNLLDSSWQKVPLLHHQQRKGSEWDLSQHYTAEFWRKARGLGRDRAVLACTFAHLIAMKTCVEGGYDFILEDNVRAPAIDEECVIRIRETILAAATKKTQNNSTEQEHEQEQADLIYFGWLGSVKNLTWVINTHAKLYKDSAVFPFPNPQKHYGDDAEINVGGTAIWGAYAYWISPRGYEALLKDTLQNDVGAMLWKGKRMRSYLAKPIDKILPRALQNHNLSVIVAQKPAFFRAPMLTSKIHAKWDPEFCKSTEYQLVETFLSWDDLWLTDIERLIVAHRLSTGVWITEHELLQTSRSRNPSFDDTTKVIDDNEEEEEIIANLTEVML